MEYSFAVGTLLDIEMYVFVCSAGIPDAVHAEVNVQKKVMMQAIIRDP